jgi:hypothetical protein
LQSAATSAVAADAGAAGAAVTQREIYSVGDGRCVGVTTS